MNITLMVAFWGVSLLFVLTPGVDWAYAISSGMRRGGVFPAVSGMLTGHTVVVLIVAAGIAAFVTDSDTAMIALTLAGAAYLVWLGVGSLRRPARFSPAEQQSGLPGTGRLFVKGMGVSLLNPKVFLLLVALLPQFATTAAWPLGAQLLVLGLLNVLNCALIYYAVGFGASVVFSRHPGATRAVGVVSGVVMILLGLAMAAEKILPAVL